ncbi:MAG TPA: winged helix-turn-helix domain-containing protein [Pyrinomonadaceae bacterium]|nr:winged helix-turn-helix domain-containing protein [Pyrinomonadaceae bacterium]
MSQPPKFVYEFGPFCLDTEERVLLRDGQRVPLKPKVYDTLLALVRNSKHVVEKEKLMQEVWPDTFVEENNLTGNIFALRKAFDRYNFIETVPRRGYCFTADVRKVQVEAINLSSQETNSFRQVVIRKAISQRTGQINSLAVLPFINASADPNAEYLTDGITESIINNLSQLPQLRVMSSSSVSRYKNRTDDPQQLGRELGVRAVLLGRVLHLGDKLIIRTSLVDAADGSQLWGKQYDRTTPDILETQEEIAREISFTLRLRLSGEEQRLLTKRHTENIDAYHMYLRGRYYWNKRTSADLERAIGHFWQAIDADPLYALAYVGIADCYNWLGYIFGRVPPEDAMPKARAASLKALEIDDQLAEAYASLAFVKFVFEWQWKEAQDYFRRAIELNPGYAPVRHFYSVYLATVWRQFDQALAEIKKGLELDPLSLPINHMVGFLLLLARRPDEAIAQFRKTLEIDPRFKLAHNNMGYAFEYKQMYAEAVEEFVQGNPFGDTSEESIAALKSAFSDSGWEGYLRKQLDLSLERWKTDEQWHAYAYSVARNYARLDDKDNAFLWLEKAYTARSGMLIWLPIELHFDSLRSDPRYMDLQRRLGLPSAGPD